jgi:hypothetical protein
MFTERGFEIEPKDIRWVLTVPAIWSEAAKQFMRKSANLVNTIYTKLTRAGMYNIILFYIIIIKNLKITSFVKWT